MDIPHRATGAKLRHARGLAPVKGPNFGAERKWLDSGQPNRYEGWSVVAPVPLDCAFIDPSLDVLQSFQADYAPGEWSIHPLSSLHMTVFGGMTQYTLDEPGAPAWALKHDNLPAVWKEAVDRIAAAELPRISSPLEVEVVEFADLNINGHVNVQFTTAQQAQEVSDLRHALAEATQWIPGDIDNYEFHISYSYRLITPPSMDAVALDGLQRRYTELLQSTGSVRLNPPVVTVFESMVSFPGVIQLG